ncbi:hypothetical protein [Dinoroseobacter sp. S124A]|uniref:hypothetical protein n=1 Tax=Dinoroseobacter sp. S124A TaxID=3415128 RepID=UPI003C7C4678
MPEDGLLSFKFVKHTDTGRDVGDMINDAIARYFEAEFSLAESRAQKPAEPSRDIAWEDDVPPNFGDGVEFLL